MQPPLLVIVLFACAPIPSFGSATITPIACNCTTDATALYSWYAPPTLRGTIDIVWGCLSTLFVCVWASLHLNIPAATDSMTTHTLRKLKWMGVAVVLPELVASIAIVQWIGARKVASEMRDLGYPSWTTTHGFFINMGGCTVSMENSDTTALIMGWEIGVCVRDGRLAIPDSALTTDTINDHSKANWVVKGLACLQALWLIIQCITRKLQGLPITILEVSTMAYVVCALVTYLCWWSKPLDVMSSICIGEIHGRKPLERSRVKNKISVEDSFSASALGMALSVVFGCIHCAAWNFEFPSPAERTIWRVASVLLPILGPLYGLFVVFLKITFGALSPGAMYTPKNVKIFGAVMFGTIRLFLLIEPFLALRSLRGDIYQTVQWTRYIPHL